MTIRLITLVAALIMSNIGTLAQEAIMQEAGAVTIAPSGAEDDTPTVLAALEKCRAEKARRLVFTPGAYNFHAGRNPANATIAFILQDMHDLTIDGQGSLLNFHGLTGCFLFVNCSNITVQGFIIDYPKPAQSVGTVIASEGKQFDVDVLPEFPVVGGEPVEAFMDFDPETRLPRRRGVDVYYGVDSTELIAPQLLRVHTKSPCNVPVGVLVALRHKVYGPSGFVMSRCSDMRLQDITIYYVPGMGAIGSVSRNITLERFNVLLKPGTDRLVSASADATHFGGCKGTVRIQDCVFEGMGDDAVNIKSGLYLSVRKIEDERTILGQHNLKMVDAPDPGDTMELCHVDNLVPYATATVETVAVLPGGENTHRVVLRDPLPEGLREGDVLGNASRAPAIRISNCEIRRNRARGFLIQSRDAVIENCRFKDITGGGIWVMTEVVHFFESIGTRDITVRNCTFDNCNYGAALGDGVLSAFAWLKDFRFPPEPGVHRNILFEGNTIRGADNAGIFVAGVDGITIRNNTIEGACNSPTREQTRGALSILSSRNVTLEGNIALPEKQGAGCTAALSLAPDVETETVKIEGNTGF